MSRDTVIALFPTVAMGVATVVCIRLQKWYAISLGRLIRIFCLVTFATVVLEMQIVTAVTGRVDRHPTSTQPASPVPSHSTG